MTVFFTTSLMSFRSFYSKHRLIHSQRQLVLTILIAFCFSVLKMEHFKKKRNIFHTIAFVGVCMPVYSRPYGIILRILIRLIVTCVKFTNLVRKIRLTH